MKSIYFILFLCPFVFSQTCDRNNNLVGGYNADCRSSDRPYCEITTAPLPQCSVCHLTNQQPGPCDCPPNQVCDPDSCSATAGSCITLDILGRGCVTSDECPVTGCAGSSVNYLTFYYLPCVQGFCAMCDPSTFVQCTGGCPHPNSSRAGETRLCGPDGKWVGGGEMLPPTTCTTTTTCGSSTGRTVTSSGTQQGGTLQSSDAASLKPLFASIMQRDCSDPDPRKRNPLCIRDPSTHMEWLRNFPRETSFMLNWLWSSFSSFPFSEE